ncbi:quinol:electron acceptor oxidoreductase subunit ActD [Schlesneria sp. T3-172]|uniref:quinol:electron acceptor oxidoreductase subunit ActD n=1 Tax=Schlesneria TaxID=656899 RepID=UPI002EF740B5
MSAVMLEDDVAQRDEVNESSRPSVGVLAEFVGPDELIRAAKLVRTRGFTKTDAFSPFPVHGIDAALGIRPTRLPWFVLIVGTFGGLAALLMQWWMNAVDYPFLISGKPTFSLPANIPVMFEVIVLLSAFTTFFGMLALNRLPKHSNPLLDVDQFRRVTNDRFFLYVDAADPNNEKQDVVELFRMADAVAIREVPPSQSSDKLPSFFGAVVAVALTLATVPVVGIAWARTTTSDAPRIDFFADMDSQDRPGPQQRSKLFADGRSMRPQVPGTVALGDFHEDDSLFLGYQPSSEPPVNVNPDPNAPPVEPDYLTQFPYDVTEARMLRGQAKYNIYCAPCHGLVGQGDGLISLRAISLQEPTWVPPTNLTNDIVTAQPVGKLFDTISHGRRKMAGYAAQIEPEDRWSIVLYVQALQRSQRASLNDVPQDEATILQNRK